MTHIPDLASVSYSGQTGRIRAVGWLEASHPFNRGSPEQHFFERLMALVARPPAFMHMGMHWCSLCAAEGRPGPDCRSSQRVLFVPGADCVYETPIWIGHYVHGHSYQPPEEFCRAVHECPEPGTGDFLEALITHVASLSDHPEPFFRDWGEGARKTLQPDPENGDMRRFLDRIRNKLGDSEPALNRSQVIEEHGGLSARDCAWAGCENRALADMAICIDHACPGLAD